MVDDGHPTADPLLAFGRWLKRERELRELEREDLAATTRLGLGVIEALESGDEGRMPPRAYVVGYLRSYAAAVGLDPDELVLRWQEAAGPARRSRRRPERAPVAPAGGGGAAGRRGGDHAGHGAAQVRRVSTRFKLSALILRTVDYGEADRVVTLLSRERGKLVAFARGARASKRRFGGGLEPFTLVSAELAARGGGDAMARLDSVSVDRSFHHIRGDLARIGCAAYAAELSGALVRDHEPHPALFDLLVEYLDRLDAAPARPAGLRVFELGALEAAGFQPRLDGCARCGAAAGAEGRGAAFSPADGGLLCGRCAEGAVGTTRLSAEALAALRRFQADGFGAAEEEMSSATGRELREALGRFVEQLLGHRLQARRFLDEVASQLGDG